MKSLTVLAALLVLLPTGCHASGEGDELVHRLAVEWTLKPMSNLIVTTDLEKEDELARLLAIRSVHVPPAQIIARYLFHAPAPVAKIIETRMNHQSVDARRDSYTATTDIIGAIADSATRTKSGPDMLFALSEVGSTYFKAREKGIGVDKTATEALVHASLKCELITNNLFTSRLAKAFVAASAIDLDTFTEDLQREANKLEITLNRSITPEKAATVAALARQLKNAETGELTASRDRVRTLLRETLANAPNAVASFLRTKAIAARLETDELNESRRLADTLIEQAGRKLDAQ
jgi:hypothetical protein